MRIGLIAQKVGMTRIFSSDGQHLPVTVLHVENCQILRVKKEKNFNIVQLGSFDQKANRLSNDIILAVIALLTVSLFLTEVLAQQDNVKIREGLSKEKKWQVI